MKKQMNGKKEMKKAMKKEKDNVKMRMDLTSLALNRCSHVK